MSAQVWPPISDEDRIIKEEESLAAELQWLLSHLQSALTSLKSGLLECLALLNPAEPTPTTLALSSLRSEAVKGFVTRVGARIVKGDIQLRLTTLPPPSRGQPSYPLRLTSELALPQLSHLLECLNQALDIIDVSRWTGDPRDGGFIASQLKLLSDTIAEARATLKGGDEVEGCLWYEDVPDEGIFEPPLQPLLAPHLSICDAALVLHIRTLAHPPVLNSQGTDPLSSFTGLSIRTRLGLAARPQVHDELDQVFEWRGQEVSVREKVRVESQDPSLMAVMAKLSALGHSVEGWRLKVNVVRGEDVD